MERFHRPFLLPYSPLLSSIPLTLRSFVEGPRGFRLLDQFNSQDLSNLMYALARMQFRPGPAWFKSLLLCSQSKLGTFSPQHLANILWAFGRLRLGPTLQWLLAYADEVEARLGSFNRTELLQVRLCAWREQAGFVAFLMGMRPP